jgi:hypothetical protein
VRGERRSVSCKSDGRSSQKCAGTKEEVGLVCKGEGKLWVAS